MTMRTTPKRLASWRRQPDVDALYIKDPGGLLSAQRARTLIPGDQGGDRRRSRWSCMLTARSASPSTCLCRCAELRRERASVRIAAVAADGTSNPPVGARGREPSGARAQGGHRRRGARRSGPLLHASSRKPKACRPGKPQAVRCCLSRSTSCRVAWSARCGASWRRVASRISKAR